MPYLIRRDKRGSNMVALPRPNEVPVKKLFGQRVCSNDLLFQGFSYVRSGLVHQPPTSSAPSVRRLEWREKLFFNVASAYRTFQ
jgi:hypothetical protein